MDEKIRSESDKNANKRSRGRLNGFEEWGGYMSSKKLKLIDQYEKQKSHEIAPDEKRSRIFEGISIFVNGYTKPSANELKRLMILHGGTYHFYKTGNTTHTIASMLPRSKINNLKRQSVLTPEWITDSIKARKLLPPANYLLCKPEVFNQKQLNLVPKAPPVSECEPTISAAALNLNKSPFMSSTLSATGRDSHQTTSHCVSASSSKNITDKVADDVTGKLRTPLRAGDPGFISEFYSHSRLHHISTACQDMKLYVQQLAKDHQGRPFPGRKALISISNVSDPYYLQTGQEKTIIHLDMDCFFVSVGVRKHSELEGHPVAVAHSQGRQKNQEKAATSNAGISSDEEEKPIKMSYSSSEYGSLSEIASCNYLARQAGLRNGMFLGEALRCCPELKIIPYDFEAYTEVSKQLYNIVASFTLDIEAVSCDELYIDCTELLHDTRVSPLNFASFLRKQIYEKTGCTASAGIGCNMLVARLATRISKPNGQYLVQSTDVSDFIINQEVKNLPGVGYANSSRLKKLGVHTCGDLQKWPLARLQKEFGPRKGQTLFEHCRGKDGREVSFNKDRKSVSVDINYGIRLKTEEELQAFIQEVAAELELKLKNIKKKGRTITFKAMVRKPNAPVETEKFLGHGACDNVSKSATLLSATDNASMIANECQALVRSLKVPPHELRGLGIQISKLESCIDNDKSIKKIDSYVLKAGPSSVAKKTAVQDYASAVCNISGALESEQLDRKAQNRSAASNRNELAASSNVPWQELDQSVLNALPEDIRKEVISSYSKNSLVTRNSNIVKSPQTKHKVTKQKKNKKGSSCGSNQQAISKYCGKACVSVQASASTTSLSSSQTSAYASLIGARDIDEVRALVKEWVASSQDPAEEDIEEFKNYLFSLMEENLEKTDLVLKYFYRLVNSAGELWRECYLTILSYVQQKMLDKYGHMLKARSDFSST